MLSKTLSALDINMSIELSRLPKTDKFVDISGVQVPLYGELLVGETELQAQVAHKALPILKSINKLYMALGNPNTRLSELIGQIQLGKVVTEVKEPVELDYDKLGYLELRELADKVGVQSQFLSTDILIDGQPSTVLLDLIIKYFSIWVNNGVTASDSVGMANFILAKKTVMRTVDDKVIEVDGTELLKNCGLTWDELLLFKELDSPTFTPLLIIYFRTGVDSFDPLMYLTSSQSEAVLRVLQKEITPSNEEVEPVVANHNIQTDISPSEGSAPLKPVETITTSQSPTPSN